MLTNTELSAIRARCEAATPGPWINEGNEIYGQYPQHIGHTFEVVFNLSGEDAAFIAAANPEAVKRLVAMTRLTIDALIHIRDKKPAWCRNECNPCRPECVARHVIDTMMNR